MNSKLHDQFGLRVGVGSEVTAEKVQLMKKAQLLRVSASKLKGVSPRTLEVSIYCVCKVVLGELMCSSRNDRIHSRTAEVFSN